MAKVAVQDAGLAPAIQEFHRIFEAVNREKYGSELPSPIITIQSQGRKQGVLGWCTTWEAWQKVKEDEEEATEGRFEINMSAEYMSRTTMELLETLVHEIAHMANAHYGIKDCSGNQYHNKHFKAQAEHLGLEVEKVQSRGWAFTKLTPELEEWLKAQEPDEKAFEFARGAAPQGKKAKTKMRKWTCGCTIVRAAVELDAVCQKCGYEFTKEPEDGEED